MFFVKFKAETTIYTLRNVEECHGTPWTNWHLLRCPREIEKKGPSSSLMWDMCLSSLYLECFMFPPSLRGRLDIFYFSGQARKNPICRLTRLILTITCDVTFYLLSNLFHATTSTSTLVSEANGHMDMHTCISSSKVLPTCLLMVARTTSLLFGCVDSTSNRGLGLSPPPSSCEAVFSILLLALGTKHRPPSVVVQ